MDNIGKRLDQDLKTATSRLRQLGGAVAVEERPGAIGDNSPCADEVDEIHISANREIGLATREMLVQHVNRLSAALDRLNDGEYGVCVDCAEPISPARLHVMPEVQTCVRCQDGIERLERLFDPSRSSVFASSTNGVMSSESQASVRSSYFPNEEDRHANR
jgi:DnaK suppressor protein